MKVSMLKLVTLASAASATQAALLCTTDKFCATADSSKPHCIYTAATDSECKAALLATTTACFKSSTADALQCAATDFCDYSNTTPADRKCKTKIVKTQAAVGSNAAEKAASCKSGEVDSSGNCNPASDAGCTAEAGSAEYYVKTDATTFACGAVGTLIASGSACFQASTTDAIQCATTDECIAQASGMLCKTKATNDATCKTNSASTLPFFVKATATAASTCASGLALDAACFIKTTATANQCATGHYCPATSDAATNKCKARLATGATCVTADSGVDCLSGTCTSAKCVGKANAATCTVSGECLETSYCDTTCKAKIANDATCTTDESCASGYCSGTTTKTCKASLAPTATTGAPTAATTAPSKAPTKADHSDASAITASAFVVASTVFASSVFA